MEKAGPNRTICLDNSGHPWRVTSAHKGLDKAEMSAKVACDFVEFCRRFHNEAPAEAEGDQGFDLPIEQNEFVCAQGNLVLSRN
jgi:hypothetical protein